MVVGKIWDEMRGGNHDQNILYKNNLLSIKNVLYSFDKKDTGGQS